MSFPGLAGESEYILNHMTGRKIYYVYILSNRHNTVLYIGVTGSISRRLIQHISKAVSGSFTSKYAVNKLVYYEAYGNAGMAIQREKRLKKWNRQWKNRLIEKDNPEWQDIMFQKEYVD